MPGPVKVWTLKFVQTIDSVPPDAAINAAVDASDCKPESVTNQPCVESINTNVTAIPSVSKVALIVEPPILSEPFWTNVTLFDALKVPA